jgi:hypothetical protein
MFATGAHTAVAYDRGVITAAESPDPVIRDMVLTYLETGATNRNLRAQFVQEKIEPVTGPKSTWGAAHRSHETRQPFLAAVALLLSGAVTPVKTAVLFEMFQSRFPDMTTSDDIAVFKRRLRDQNQIMHASGGYILATPYTSEGAI